jgi:hypothetical protein
MPDGAYLSSGCRTYYQWSLTKGTLEICFDDGSRTVRMTFTATRPVTACCDVVLLTDTFKLLNTKLGATSATPKRTTGEGLIVQTMTLRAQDGTEVVFGGSIRLDSLPLEASMEEWDDSLIVKTVTVAYVSRLPFGPRSVIR